MKAVREVENPDGCFLFSSKCSGVDGLAGVALGNAVIASSRRGKLFVSILSRILSLMPYHSQHNGRILSNTISDYIKPLITLLHIRHLDHAAAFVGELEFLVFDRDAGAFGDGFGQEGI